MRITVPRIRIALLPVMLVTLLIRPASNTDNAKFYETAKTYSELFEVIGTLLRDHLTELNVFEKALSPKSHVAGQGFPGSNRQDDSQYDKRPDTMDRAFSQNRITCGSMAIS